MIEKLTEQKNKIELELKAKQTEFDTINKKIYKWNIENIDGYNKGAVVLVKTKELKFVNRRTGIERTENSTQFYAIVDNILFNDDGTVRFREWNLSNVEKTNTGIYVCVHLDDIVKEI